MKRNAFFPVGLAKQTKKEQSRKRESLTADLTQNHAGVSENTKMSTDRLTLILMLNLKLFLLKIVVVSTICHYVLWAYKLNYLILTGTFCLKQYIPVYEIYLVPTYPSRVKVQ